MQDFTSLNITILDVNDNTPEFDIGILTQEITVAEDAAPGTRVFKVNAADKDEGINARVSFSLRLSK